MKIFNFGNRHDNYNTGGRTVLYDEQSGKLGYSLCTPKDTFSNRIGKELALKMLNNHSEQAFNTKLYPNPSRYEVALVMERILNLYWINEPGEGINLKWVRRFVEDGTLFTGISPVSAFSRVK